MTALPSPRLRIAPAPPESLPHPNDIALKLTGRDYISYSAISTYQKCPLKYFFQYIAGLPHELVSASLVFGGAIHSAIEAFYYGLLAEDRRLAVDELLARFDDAWKGQALVPVQYGKDEDQNSLRDLAARVLRAFLAHEVSKLDSTVLGIEEEFRAPVIPGCPDLLGRLDLILLTRDHIRVLDFKTARSRWNESSRRDSAPQMLMYQELIRPLVRDLGDRSLRMEWAVLTKTKSPTVELHAVPNDPHESVRTQAVVRRVWESIRAGHFYPSPSAMNCPTCPFQKACRQWEG